ncbi:MAG: hypothetical protein NZ902_02815 [Acidilobaceae archaeon]|nr:hypothetical protein [Acidilobaceae archaeon]MCX8165752.1 hypothetical protein [Acidilobaceae archaeon]MDW7974177.1 hypothetical protein [Sulfolobales archaeon]
MLKAKISSVSVDQDGLYSAELQIEYLQRSHTFKMEKIIRKPHRAKGRVEGEYLIINIEDNEGKPLSSCCIHLSHLEKGCTECKNLMSPPREV